VGAGASRRRSEAVDWRQEGAFRGDA
jgi:hypothetical protein